MKFCTRIINKNMGVRKCNSAQFFGEPVLPASKQLQIQHHKKDLTSSKPKCFSTPAWIFFSRIVHSQCYSELVLICILFWHTTIPTINRQSTNLWYLYDWQKLGYSRKNKQGVEDYIFEPQEFLGFLYFKDCQQITFVTLNIAEILDFVH